MSFQQIFTETNSLNELPTTFQQLLHVDPLDPMDGSMKIEPREFAHGFKHVPNTKPEVFFGGFHNVV